VRRFRKSLTKLRRPHRTVGVAIACALATISAATVLHAADIETTSRELGETEKALTESREEAEQLGRQLDDVRGEIDIVQRELVDAAAQMQLLEARQTLLARDLAQVSASRDAQTLLLDDNRQEMAMVLAALQRLSGPVPVAAATVPSQSTDDIERAGVLLSGIVRALDGETDEIRQDVEELARLEQSYQGKRADLDRATNALKEQRRTLDALLLRQQSLSHQTEVERERAEARTAELAEKAASLGELLAALEDEQAREIREREQLAREQAAREKEAREQAAREQAARDQAAEEQAARDLAAKGQAAQEQAAMELAAQEQAEREKAREHAEREAAVRQQAARTERAREARARAAGLQATLEVRATDEAADTEPEPTEEANSTAETPEARASLPDAPVTAAPDVPAVAAPGASATPFEGERPVAEARGSFIYPVSGRLIARFGQTNASGLAAKGIVIETGNAAQIVAPFDGRVVFAGPFQGYGQLLIIAHGEGYHSLLSGLGLIETRLGQTVLAGDSVGVMASTSGDRPRLYVELRRKGLPINPLPWLSAADDKVKG
jgi:septal ring factor EnvC (AmiA/AmiB activator)